MAKTMQDAHIIPLSASDIDEKCVRAHMCEERDELDVVLKQPPVYVPPIEQQILIELQKHTKLLQQLLERIANL